MMKILFAKKTRTIMLVLLIMCVIIRGYLHDDTDWLLLATGYSIGYLVAGFLRTGGGEKRG